MNFKERLREEIEYKGLQIKEVAALAGVNNNTFLSYVDARGSLPNVEIGVKIAKALGVSVEYLVTGKDSNTLKTFTLPPKQRKVLDAISSFDDTDLDAIIALANALKKRYPKKK